VRSATNFSRGKCCPCCVHSCDHLRTAKRQGGLRTHHDMRPHQAHRLHGRRPPGLAGTKISIADIDTPKTHPPRSAREARLGQAETLKMQPLLNAGPFTLTPIKRDVDR
jgi:hypothetical protein